MLTVIAMPEEVELLQDKSNYIVTGVGALNVFNSLKDIDRNEQIYNIGYAGSNNIPIGTKVRIGKVKSYHPNADFIEPEYNLDGNIVCFTSSDFVLSTCIEESCVFDMELAYILAMGFKNVVSEKIISDCLNKEQFYENTKLKSRGD